MSPSVTRKRTKSARYLLFGVSASLIVALDQLTKFWAESYLVGQGSIPVIGELLQFRLAYNNAAAFSLGVGATWVLTTISLAASIALIALSPRIKTMTWALIGGMALGGAVGNLIDRAFKQPEFFNGHVVDFIQIPFNFPIFNLADTFLVVAVSLAILRTLMGDEIGGGRAK
ncbi:MAG: signal peptidase II [Aquiluna sp.]|nr:signal peptidase II [Actinomycetota bacterium]NCW41519.1 signal peptidase II [Actinomycetota bacterium]NDA12749.1 signal peptidase II [Actinomycetota bacterium]